MRISHGIGCGMNRMSKSNAVTWLVPEIGIDAINPGLRLSIIAKENVFLAYIVVHVSPHFVAR